MADAPEALSFAEAIRARTAVMHYVGWLSEGTGVDGALSDVMRPHIARYEALADRFDALAVHLLDAGDVAAQRAELYR